jgi:hypothetical protein
MSSERDWLFKQLDSHTREQYECFVAEMFLNDDQSKYIVCFHPVLTMSADRYACRYFEINQEEVKAAHNDKLLADSIIGCGNWNLWAESCVAR